MALTIKNAKNIGSKVPDWTQNDLDRVIAGGNPPLPPAGTKLADVVLRSDYLTPMSVTGTLDVVNGGFGQDMTMQSVATATNISALPAGLIKMTGSTPCQINGIAAPTTSNFCYIENASSTTVYLLHQASAATAANRMILPTGFSILIPSNMGATLFYDTVTARWRLIDMGLIVNTQAPLGVSQGTLYMPQASSAQSGYLANSDWTTFNNKLGGSPLTNSVPYYINSSSYLYTNGNFGYNSTTGRFRVGVPDGSDEATGHFKSDTSVTIPDLLTASAVLTPFTLLSAPSVYSVSQSTPNLNRSSNAGTSIIGSSSTYTAGDVIDYKIICYNSDSTQTFSVVSRDTTVTINNTGDEVDISWNFDGAGLQTVSGYTIQRQVNSGGYNDAYDVGNVSTFHDDGTLWGSYPTTPTYPDFVANGSSTNFDAYSYDTGLGVFSASSYNFPFTDNSSGDAYLRVHSISSGAGTARVIRSSIDYADGLNFTEDATGSPFTSGSTVTPTTYGQQADGSFWNKTYDFYNWDSTPAIFSVNPISSSTTDPGDFNYYYAVCNFTGQTTYAKILRDGVTSEQSASSPVIDDGSTGWTGNTTVTPNGYYPKAGLFEAHGSSLADKAALTIRSLDGTFANIDFENSAKVRTGSLTMNGAGDLVLGNSLCYYLAGSTGNMTVLGTDLTLNTSNSLVTYTDVLQMNTTTSGQLFTGGSVRFGWSAGGVAMYAPSGGTAGIYYNGTARFLNNSTGMGFFNTSPVAQQTGDIATALSNYGLVISPTVTVPNNPLMNQVFGY